MGLSERRALKTYQEEIFPLLKLKIDTAAGFAVPVEVDWEKLATPGEASRYLDDSYFTDTYFTPIIEAFKKITIDDLGKDALRKGLLKVVITCNPGVMTNPASPDAWPFKDGVVLINDHPGAPRSPLDVKINTLVQNLESKL